MFNIITFICICNFCMLFKFKIWICIKLINFTTLYMVYYCIVFKFSRSIVKLKKQKSFFVSLGKKKFQLVMDFVLKEYKRYIKWYADKLQVMDLPNSLLIIIAEYTVVDECMHIALLLKTSIPTQYYRITKDKCLLAASISGSKDYIRIQFQKKMNYKIMMKYCVSFIHQYLILYIKILVISFGNG